MYGKVRDLCCFCSFCTFFFFRWNKVSRVSEAEFVILKTALLQIAFSRIILIWVINPMSPLRFSNPRLQFRALHQQQKLNDRSGESM